MESQFPAIVIIAYNRVHCLKRLLKSVTSAQYPEGNITLIISIDKSNVTEVRDLANEVEWKYGQKRVIAHHQHLGLKEHVLHCGDFTDEYGSIIMLEDDLLVSPWFYDYALQARNFYEEDEKIAGISLYNYQIAENRFSPFYPLHDGSDVYFVQVASSWGQLFFANTWSDFRLWLKSNDTDTDSSSIPAYQKEWSAHSWKKRFNRFLIERDKFFVFPRISLSTNFGDEGVNTDRAGLYQVGILNLFKEFKFSSFVSSRAVYDAWFEILPAMIPSQLSELKNKDITCDLLGTKELAEVKTRYLLSCKPCKKPISSFGNLLISPEQNIYQNIEGDFFSFGFKEDFLCDSYIDRASFFINVNSIKDIVLDSEIQRIGKQESEKAHRNIQQQVDLYKQKITQEQEDFKTELTHKLELDKEDFKLKFLQDFELNQKYPKVYGVIINSSNSNNAERTMESFMSQNYPETQLQCDIFDNECTTNEITLAIDNSNAKYFVVLYAGDLIFDSAAQNVNQIFQRYADINWLTGIQTVEVAKKFQINTSNMATRRWSRFIFETNLYKSSGRYIPPAATFFKRYLWDIAKPHLNIVSKESFCNDLWQAFFKVQNLYTTESYLSSTPVEHRNQLASKKRVTLIEDSFKDKLLEFFYTQNIPFLRTYYKMKNELPPVIRFDFRTNSYWLSDY